MADPKEVARWTAEEWERRTKEIEAGRGQIYWADPRYRVSWSDLQHKFKDLKHTDRADLQKDIDAEFRKRGILKKLRMGKAEALMAKKRKLSGTQPKNCKGWRIAEDYATDSCNTMYYQEEGKRQACEFGIDQVFRKLSNLPAHLDGRKKRRR